MAWIFCPLKCLQPIEALSGTEEILKAALRAAFKIFPRFEVSAKRCNPEIIK